LKAQKTLYAASNEALRDGSRTTLVLVARPDTPSLREAERTRGELAQLGVCNVYLLLNGIFRATDRQDAVAVAMERQAEKSLGTIPEGLRNLPRTEVPLLPYGLVGIEALKTMGTASALPRLLDPLTDQERSQFQDLDALVGQMSQRGRGVIMTMGKGGVGKTSLAVRIAIGLAKGGLPVTLTTTDPAAHVEQALGERPPTLTVTRIDPEAETQRYTQEVLANAGKDLDAKGRALLEEDLRSPCTEEIAVFRAFAETVAQGEDRFVVIDTAPTGHTILLLDAAEAYHREVLKKASDAPEAVRNLLPRLRDTSHTSILLVTLPEATPIHEAMQLERDLERADIHPFAWVVNQSLTPLTVKDPILKSRQGCEAIHLRELAAHATRIVLEPWNAAWDGTHRGEGLPNDETASSQQNKRIQEISL